MLRNFAVSVERNFLYFAQAVMPKFLLLISFVEDDEVVKRYPPGQLKKKTKKQMEIERRYRPFIILPKNWTAV